MWGIMRILCLPRAFQIIGESLHGSFLWEFTRWSLPIMSKLWFCNSSIRFLFFEIVKKILSQSHGCLQYFHLEIDLPPRALSFPTGAKARMRLTKTGLGRLSFSQIFGRDTPKSCPAIGDVGDMGKLSRWVLEPRQKAQFMIDLRLLNVFWPESKEEVK